jgi:thiamine transport system permease protein
MRPALVRGSLAALPLALFLLTVAILPAARVLVGGALGGGAEGFAAVLSDPLDRAAFANSFEQGALSALLAGIAGYPLGVILGRYALPGREMLRSVLLVPFLLPSLVVVVGVEDLLGPGGLVGGPLPALAPLGAGLLGVLVVNVSFNASLVALLTAGAVAGAAVEQEEAVAVLGGGPWRAYRDVWGPASWLGAGAGMLLTYLLSALGFAAPLLICGARCYTLELRIWSLDEVLGAPTHAAELALLTVLFLAFPTLAYLAVRHVERRRVARRERPGRPLPRSRLLRGLAVGYVAAFFLAVAALLGAVLLRAAAPPGGGAPGRAVALLFSPATSDRLGLSTFAALANTLLFAACAALLVVLLVVVYAFARRSRAPGARLFGPFLFVPLLVSPVVLAFGLATFYRPLLGGTGATWALIVVSQATLALPFAAQALEGALAHRPRGPAEVARTLGTPPFSAFLDTELAPARRGLVSAAVFAFALGLGEFTATFFLVVPPFTTWPVELVRLGELRAAAPAAALAGLLLLLSLGSFLVLEIGGRNVEL